MTTAPGARFERLSIPFLLPEAGEAAGAVAAPEGLLLLQVRPGRPIGPQRSRFTMDFVRCPSN
jgi:hypothetical protein